MEKCLKIILFVVFIVEVGVWAYKDLTIHYESSYCTQQRCIGRSDNLDYGVPSECDMLIEREGYALGYKNDWKQAAWVMYRLTRDEVLSNEVQRTNIFTKDPWIDSYYSTPFDYIFSGYDRGHLAPAADMAWSKKAMEESFYMSNMSPQKPEFNRGIWCELEKWVRDVAKRETNIVIVTGPIVLTDDMTNTIGRNKVVVPTAFYKVIYDETPPDKMIGFVIANAGSKLSISNYAVSVDSVEEVTGLDFFNTIEDNKENKLESGCDFSEWTLGIQ